MVEILTDEHSSMTEKLEESKHPDGCPPRVSWSPGPDCDTEPAREACT